MVIDSLVDSVPPLMCNQYWLNSNFKAFLGHHTHTHTRTLTAHAPNCCTNPNPNYKTVDVECLSQHLIASVLATESRLEVVLLMSCVQCSPMVACTINHYRIIREFNFFPFLLKFCFRAN